MRLNSGVPSVIWTEWLMTMFLAASEQIVIKSDDPVDVISAAAEGQLVILGVQRIGPRRKLFGQFTRKIANQTDSPLIVISRRG